MNRPIPHLGVYKALRAEKSFSGLTHLALPVAIDAKSSSPTISFEFPVKVLKSLEKEYEFSFREELEKAGTSFAGKCGETLEISFLPKKNSLSRIILVGVGEKSPSDLRKAGAALGRKVKGSKVTLLSLAPSNPKNALTHLIALGLSTYTWSEKTSPKPETPEFLISEDYSAIANKAAILVEATWRARDLIHTPSNIKNPEWMARQAKLLAKHPRITVAVKSGKQLAEFGGLRAVGNSSRKNPPRFVEVTYSPSGRGKVPHVVLVGKGITFDTGGVSLKRPYDLMTAMKSDMAGSAAVLMTTIAAAKLGARVKVTALMMLAENALSATSQRPSDVIQHYGGTTVEVINTDAEGRLVLADGLAYADLNLNPDYLIDVATLTGAATLGLSRFYGAMYTRDQKIARNLHEIGEYTGDRLWHMPLVDDYSIALESDVADLNHTADKFKFQGGSVTAALFLEKFVGDRRWVHLDIAGPGRSDTDSGENPKGGTGFGVRALTEWICSL